MCALDKLKTDRTLTHVQRGNLCLSDTCNPRSISELASHRCHYAILSKDKSSTQHKPTGRLWECHMLGVFLQFFQQFHPLCVFPCNVQGTKEAAEFPLDYTSSHRSACQSNSSAATGWEKMEEEGLQHKLRFFWWNVGQESEKN